MLRKLKKYIEKNILYLATSKNNKPHQIAVAAVKVFKNYLIITDNFMKETKSNILKNKNVSIVLWNGRNGYELRGNAKYFNSGKWLKFVKGLKENKGYKPKGAIVVKVNKIKMMK